MNMSTLQSLASNRIKKTEIVSASSQFVNVDNKNNMNDSIGSILKELQIKAEKIKATEIVGIKFINVKNNEGHEHIMIYGTAIIEE